MCYYSVRLVVLTVLLLGRGEWGKRMAQEILLICNH